MNLKRITMKCEYVRPTTEVIKMIETNTLLAGSPDVRPGTDPTVVPPINDDDDEWEELEG